MCLRNTERNAMAVSRRFLEERHDDTKFTDIPSRGVVTTLHMEIELDGAPGGEVRKSAAEFQCLRLSTGDGPRWTSPLWYKSLAPGPVTSRSAAGTWNRKANSDSGAVRRRHHFQGESLRGPSPCFVFRRIPAVQCADQQVGMPGPAFEQNKHPFIGPGVDGVGDQSWSDPLADQTPSIPPGIKGGAIQPGRISSNSSDRCWPPWHPADRRRDPLQ